MQATGFISFFIVYMQMYLLNAEPDHRVNVMNDMFTHVGWLEWPEKRGIDYVRIIDHSMGNKIIDAKELLAPSDNGQIVTNDNVEHKMQQAQQFLTCKYALVLKEFCYYEMGICPACRKMDNPSKALNCLRTSLEMLEMSESLVMCMRGSLLCFHDLSPKTPFKEQLFVILEALIDYYKNISFDKRSIVAGGNEHIISTVATETASVEKLMSETLDQLNAFYDNCCWQVEVGEVSRHVFHVESIHKNCSLDDVERHMKNKIKETIKYFVEFFDGRFGFRYNFDLKKTILMYDPDLIQRVEEMNKLLESPEWVKLKDLEILTPNRIVTFPEFISARSNGKIVTKANVDEKVQHTHHFLNCHYALMLKRCIDYVRLIWKQYNKSTHLPGSSDLQTQFVSTVMMSEPLISRMQNAISHIYQLSPQINYGINIFYIMQDFKNYFHSQNETMDNEIVQGNRILNIEYDMKNISKRLENAYRPNCEPLYLIMTNKFLEDNAKVKYSELKNNFMKEIDNFMLSNNGDIGIPL